MASSVSSALFTAAPLRGREEPRVFTPPLRPLTEETSLGFAVIEFAEDVLGVELRPWQKWLYIHALELLEDGSFRFRTVVVLVARQNGKSTWSQVLSLFFMYVRGVRLVLGTAQDLDTAEEVWQGAVDLVNETDDDGELLRPELANLVKAVVRVNGKKSLDLTTGERYKVKAANRRAGRGLSGDLILLDELREHQNWDAWGAITKTTMARAHAVVVALSNAGDASSVVLRYLRKMAHATLGDPDGINGNSDPAALVAGGDEDLAVDDDDSLGLFEWSARPGCSIHDEDGWAQANPSLGYGGFTVRTIRAAARTDPEWVFRTEVLCQWSDGTLEGPFPTGAWDECADPESRAGASVVLAVDVSADRSMSYIGLASVRDDGLTHVEIVAQRSGTEWVVPWLTAQDRHEKVRRAAVAVQAAGAPAASLVESLEAAGVRVVEWRGSDVGAAAGAFYDAVREGRIRHRRQPVLDVAAATAVGRPVGDGWVWDRKHSPADAAPLVAVTAASWFLASESAADYDLMASVM